VDEGSRIALGTAQFGQRYGITNQLHPPHGDEVKAILVSLRNAASDTLDTAMSYGDSEMVLGAADVTGFRVVTKLPPLESGLPDVESWIRVNVRRSLERLRIDSLYGLLLHRSSDASGPRAAELLAALTALKAEGVVRKIGVSVYEPLELAAAEQTMALDLVQLPYNVLDRRFEQSGWFDRLHALGTEIHVRSAFLQGLLLVDEYELPATFARWRPVWTRWCGWLRDQGLSSLAAALGFVLRNARVNKVVVGVATAGQLQQILANAHALEYDVPTELESGDVQLINPSNWMTQ
jgi:aryl-alcohol dehydrogenase-like predicted oxidoreductase